DVLPASGDDVVINTGSGVNYTGGALSLNSLSCSTPLTIQEGTLGSTTATVSAPLTLDGGGLVGGVWSISGLTATANSSNSLSGVTINGDISLTANSAIITITNGLIVNGLVSMQGDGSVITFAGGAQTFGGNADVLFDGITGTRSVSSDNG